MRVHLGLSLALVTACADGADALDGPPIAFLGSDRTVQVGQTVRLDGSKSADPEGQPLMFAWTLLRVPSGSQAELSSLKVAQPELHIDQPGEYGVRLVVNDGNQSSPPATLRLIAADNNAAPIADAGSSVAAQVGDRVVLDGSASRDPEGASLSYIWRLQAPAGSVASLDDATIPQPSFTVDTEGSFQATLTVSDGQLTSTPDTVTIVSGGDNAPPTASIVGVSSGVLGTSVRLDGSTSSDPDGDQLTFTWQLLSKPGNSATQIDQPSAQRVDITLDAPGDYVVQLSVNDGVFDDDASHSISVSAQSDLGPVEALPFRFVDAEYSDALDQVILVSNDPNRLVLYNANTSTSSYVDLPLAPLNVSVAPDGQSAAVGHDGWISIVDLQARNLVKTMAVAARPSDVVLAGNGFVYAFPSMGQWTKIRCVDIATEFDTEQAGRSVRHQTIARLHPSGERIYGANNGLSPSDIERYDIAAGVAQYERDSPYHGDYPMCGALWFSDDGLRIFTRCANVFRSVADPASDMTYNGALMVNERIEHLDHSSSAGQIAVAQQIGFRNDPLPTQVLLFNDEFLGPDGVINLPTLTSPGGVFQWLAKFVFYSRDGSKLIVLLQAEEGSALLNDQAVKVY